MANYSAKILNNSVRSLQAQQAVIAVTSNNIANVNTPGYSRRIVDLETGMSRSSGVGVNVGNGVNVRGISRVADEFLNKVLRDAESGQSSSQIQSEFMSRMEGLFNITGDKDTIGTLMNGFFAAANDLTTNPSSIELRSVFIQRGNDLVTKIKSSFETIANLQQEADSRIDGELAMVNAVTAEIAALNSRISSTESGGQVAADERDQRDQLMSNLAKKISYSSVELEDGSVTLSLSNGFVLVSGGNSRNLETTKVPSFAPGALPPSLSGGVLSYVVYDYDPTSGGASHLDLTQILKAGDGSIGGLLAVRGYADPTNTNSLQADGPLVEMASRIEAITRNLLTRVNTTYLGPDEDAGTAGFQPSALDLDGLTPSVYGLFDFTYALGSKDANADGLPNDLAALTVDNYSSLLSMNFSDPRRVAAARDQNAVGGATTLVPGDGRNMEALVALQTTTTNFSAGSFTLNGATYDDSFNEMITHMSGLALSSRTQEGLDIDNLNTVSARRDEVSAVSLDEEFSGLIKFQKTYQASAKLIKIADELLQQVISLI